MIKNLLNESTIMLQAEVESWEGAGIKAGELLFKNGFVEQDYIERMIEAVNDFGPYIVIAPGIALFHARPEESVKEVCLSMVTLKTPVEFGAGDKDPVDLIFAFAAIDDNSHLKAISELMKILQDDQLVSNIRKEKNKEKVIENIHQKFD